MGRGGADRILYGSGLALNRAGAGTPQDAPVSGQGELFELEIPGKQLYALFYSLGRFGSSRCLQVPHVRRTLPADDPALRLFDRASRAVGAPPGAGWNWYSETLTYRQKQLLLSLDRAEAEAALAAARDYPRVSWSKHLARRLEKLLAAAG